MCLSLPADIPWLPDNNAIYSMQNFVSYGTVTVLVEVLVSHGHDFFLTHWSRETNKYYALFTEIYYSIPWPDPIFTQGAV